jgi:hypothetical protein
VHYSDDHDWAFVCGTTDATEDGRVIAMEEALALDPTLREIANLPPGWTAWRDHSAATGTAFLTRTPEHGAGKYALALGRLPTARVTAHGHVYTPVPPWRVALQAVL